MSTTKPSKSSTTAASGNKVSLAEISRRNVIKQLNESLSELEAVSKSLNESASPIGSHVRALTILERCNGLLNRHTGHVVLLEFVSREDQTKFKAFRNAIGAVLSANRGNEIERWMKEDLQIGLVASAIDRLQKSMVGQTGAKQQPGVALTGDERTRRAVTGGTMASRSRAGGMFLEEQLGHIDDTEQLINVVSDRLGQATAFFQAYQELFGSEDKVASLKSMIQSKPGLLGRAFGKTALSTLAARLKKLFRPVRGFDADVFAAELTPEVIAANERVQANVFSALGDVPEIARTAQKNLKASLGQRLSGFFAGQSAGGGPLGAPPRG